MAGLVVRCAMRMIRVEASGNQRRPDHWFGISGTAADSRHISPYAPFYYDVSLDLEIDMNGWVY
jgi:hypothetical protein